MTPPADSGTPGEPALAATQPAISLIMPTIGWGPPFDHCLRAASAALGPADELLVVFDGMPPPPPDWLLASGAVLLHTRERSGPAAARNLGAQQARRSILLFVDADVALHPDAVEIVRSRFSSDSGLQAVFGSYDATPAAPGLVSRFRNLLHHHTHTSQPGPASTFWAGCGAVRCDRFLALGGFDAEAYRKPCIEDIEFGLRLHEDNGRILLDPALQGTHHKRWTLGLMIQTDIQQRAIPWSRLLLRRRQIPATLNLSHSARLSAGLSLLLIAALAALAVPGLWPWPALVASMTLAVLLILNRSFLAVLQGNGGTQLALGGGVLHILYMVYSSLTFAYVAIVETATTHLRTPAWLKRRPLVQRNLCMIGLGLLGMLALAVMIKGLAFHWQARAGTDLHQRFAEWWLFRDRIYPSAILADAEQQSLPYFRTTVYLPWALPLFGGLFVPGGMGQGKILILSGSLAALMLIATIGWHCLRPWGWAGGWFGALAPLAITGNSNCLAHGQFSIICMGLISLQWLLIKRNRPRSAGLCWGLAMVKPQIALTFALPLLQRRHLQGLLLGSALLLGLTTAALTHTDTSPQEFLMSWFQVVPGFINVGNRNGLAALLAFLPSLQDISMAWLLGLLLTAAAILLVLAGWLLQQLNRHRIAGSLKPDTLDLAGFCAIIGFVGFYHLNYDNIMLYPALLACWRQTLKDPRSGNLMLSLLMALSVWTPQTLIEAVPGSREFQTLIFTGVGVVLLLRVLRRGQGVTALQN